MILLCVSQLVKHFGPEPVLDGVSFELRPGDKVGLVGPNGAGKSTLLRIVARLEEADQGQVILHGSAKLGYLEQHPDFPPGATVWNEAAAGLADLTELARQAEETASQIAASEDADERRRLEVRFDRLQHELASRDAYHLDHQIERVLDGLGFATASRQQPVEQLSGGQQNRLLLAKLLLSAPELLVLDEPSNHLDIEATAWLEQFLRTSDQSLLVVSHDRYFLDRVTSRTLELFDGTVDDYPGGFSAYWRLKAERLKVAERAFEKQQLEIAKNEEFVRRNFSGQKHAQAKDRQKKLDRIDRIERPRAIAAPPMGFAAVERSGDIVVRVEHLAKAYAQPLFTDLSFDVLRGERWGIVGPNGSGKTTLLRCLMREIASDDGRVIFGTRVRAGYFDQLLTGLDSAVQVVDAVRPRHKEFTEPERRRLLARFGLRGDQVFQTVGSLSGGERNRTALARLAASDANLLLLDEPTNHLDLWARDALERSLGEFQGTVILVSHDRYFLNRVCDHLLVVEPHRFRVIEGNYDTYLHLAAGDRTPHAAQTADPGTAPSVVPTGHSGATPRSKRKFPYRKVADLERDIFEREQRVQELQSQLSQPDVLRQGDLVRRVQQELSDLLAALPPLYEHWEEAAKLN